MLITTAAGTVQLLAEILTVLALVAAAAATSARAARLRRDARGRAADETARPHLLAALLDEDQEGLADAELPGWVAKRLDSAAIRMALKLHGADHAALLALMRHRGVVESARGGLTSRRAVRRLRAVETLGALSVVDTLPDLAPLLADKDPDVRRAAVRALGRIGAPSVVPALIEMLDHPGRHVAEHCVTLALMRSASHGADPLRAALSSGGPRGRQAAAQVLGWLGELGAVGDLEAALADQTVAVRVAAADALGRIGSPRSRTGLESALGRDNEIKLRAVAATALGLIGDPASVGALVPLLYDGHVLARTASAALAKLGAAGQAALEAAAATVPEARELLEPAPPRPLVTAGLIEESG